MVQTAGDDSRTDDPFEIAAQGVPGANPLIGGPAPDSADKVDAPGTILPDGRHEAGIPAFTGNSGDLFTTQTWNPQGTPPVFGMAAVFFGTVMSAFIAMLVGVPIAIGIALFISHYASR